jgi:hypothetical protein
MYARKIFGLICVSFALATTGCIVDPLEEGELVESSSETLEYDDEGVAGAGALEEEAEPEAELEADSEEAEVREEVAAPTAKPQRAQTEPEVAEVMERPEPQERADSGIPDERLVPVAGKLRVAANLFEGRITIKDADGRVFADFFASDCSSMQSDGFYVCDISLPPGEYIVVPTGVEGYITPSRERLDLGEEGAVIYLEYDVRPQLPEGTELASYYL